MPRLVQEGGWNNVVNIKCSPVNHADIDHHSRHNLQEKKLDSVDISLDFSDCTQCVYVILRIISSYHIISIGTRCVLVRACVRNGRSREVIRPLAKYYFFLWGMAIVGQKEGAQ